MVKDQREEKLELVHKNNPEDVARSLYRLMQGACLAAGDAGGGPPPEDFDRLGFELQAVWMRLAKEGPRIVEACEGQSVRQAACRLFTLATEGDLSSVPDERFRVLWDMLAKHLFMLIDCDTAPSLADCEQVLLDWFRGRLTRLEQR